MVVVRSDQSWPETHVLTAIIAEANSALTFRAMHIGIVNSNTAATSLRHHFVNDFTLMELIKIARSPGVQSAQTTCTPPYPSIAMPLGP